MPIDPNEPEIPDDGDDFAFGDAGGTGFNYAAFEESLQNSEEEDRPTDPGMVEEQVQSRPTIDLRRVPQDDAVYEIRELGKFVVVTIRGRINESFAGDTLGEKLQGSIVFDLTEVDRITSFGVRAWLQMLNRARIREAYFVRASPAVVNQVTMMRNFCGPAKIHSLVAPYACEHCGNEFGVTYDAITDRTALRARNPFLVECPACRKAAELDEDPWVFFGIDEQLLEEVPTELQKVLDHLGDQPQHAPIEKAFIDDTTRIRFNGVVDGSTRFSRAFTGLEGPIVVDLRTAASVTPEAIQILFKHLSELDPAITSAQIEGCPIPLLELLLASSPDRVTVRSVTTDVISDRRDMRRPVVIDLKRHGTALSRGRVPDLDIPWRDEPIRLEGMDLLTQAAQRVQATPPPAPTSSRTASSASPEAKDQSAAPGSPPRTRSSLPLLLVGGVGLVAVAAAVVLVLGSAIFFTQAPADPAPAAPEPAVAESAWSTGGLLPPAWAEQPVSQQGDAFLLSGIGIGDSLSEALVHARQSALRRLLPLAEQAVTVPPDDALPAAGPERDAAEARWVGIASTLPLERVQDASRINGTSREVAIQYRLPKAAFDALMAPYNQTGTFRGLSFVSRPPWAPPGLRLTASTVPEAQVGDLLVSIGGQPINAVAELETKARAAFDALPPGGKLVVVLSRGGQPVEVTLTKPRPRAVPQLEPKPAPEPADRLVPELNLPPP